MNIDDYRAMVAQEKAQQNSPQTEGEHSNAQTQPSTTEPVSQGVQTTQQSEPTPPSNTGETGVQTPPVPNAEPSTPQTIVIEGVGEVSLEELQKGYLRQSDYTKKTQQLANQRREVEQAVSLFDQIKSNPDVAQQLSEQFPELSPEQLRVQELETKYQDLLLEREVERLQSKYEDFDVREVLQVAYDKKLENIEDAYLLVRSQKAPTQSAPTTQTLDIEQVKAQLRQELKQELELELGTTSIIQTGGATPPKTQDTPTLSNAEQKVARMMRLSDADYVKWRDQK